MIPRIFFPHRRRLYTVYVRGWCLNGSASSLAVGQREFNDAPADDADKVCGKLCLLLFKQHGSKNVLAQEFADSEARLVLFWQDAYHVLGVLLFAELKYGLHIVRRRLRRVQHVVGGEPLGCPAINSVTVLEDERAILLA